VLIDVRW
jgi:hypothetical protein